MLYDPEDHRVLSAARYRTRVPPSLDDQSERHDVGDLHRAPLAASGSSDRRPGLTAPAARADESGASLSETHYLGFNIAAERMHG